MLGKLLKYDMKTLSRFLIVIHVFLLAASILGRIFLTGRINFDNEKASEILLFLSYLLFFIIFMAVMFGTLIIIAVFFYKNMFSDEGYLTHTLPVPRGHLLLSKTIAGSIWGIIDIICVYVCLFILVATPYVIKHLKAAGTEALRELGIPTYGSLQKLLILLLLLTFIGGISNTIEIYASVTIGQLFGNHRVLGSIVAYFALSTVLSVLSFIALAATGNFTIPVTSDFNFYQYFVNTFSISIIFSIIIIVILYITAHMIIKKKLNLN